MPHYIPERTKEEIEAMSKAELDELLELIKENSDEFAGLLRDHLVGLNLTIETAKEWIAQWTRDGQEFPFLVGSGYETRMASCKWMSAFLAMVIERRPVHGDDYGDGEVLRYFDTQNGAEFYRVTQENL